MKNNIFKGLITAIITPFKDNKLDLVSLEKILNYQIDNKVDGVVIAGSTGEGSSLSLQEYQSLLEMAVEITKNRTQIIAGCSAITTNIAIDMIKICTKIPVDGLIFQLSFYLFRLKMPYFRKSGFFDNPDGVRCQLIWIIDALLYFNFLYHSFSSLEKVSTVHKNTRAKKGFYLFWVK